LPLSVEFENALEAAFLLADLGLKHLEQFGTGSWNCPKRNLVVLASIVVPAILVGKKKHKIQKGIGGSRPQPDLDIRMPILTRKRGFKSASAFGLGARRPQRSGR
jgi:hypothetical protein